MNFWNIILPILVGAVIGYITNNIAIKMLFHPKKEIYIGKWKVPFTPGVIPKNRKRIANAIGTAVSEQLLTKEDIIGKIQNSNAKQIFADKVTETIMESDISLQKLGDMTECINNFGYYVGDEVVNAINDADLNPMIRDIGSNALQDFLQNPMIGMFLNENVLNGIYAKMSDSIKEYIKTNGKEVVGVFMEEQIKNICENPVKDTLAAMYISKETVEAAVMKLFDSMIGMMGDSLIDSINIKEIVQTKVDQMNVDELEDLVMSIMKNELQAVINLGAIIGAVIGIINIFI